MLTIELAVAIAYLLGVAFVGGFLGGYESEFANPKYDWAILIALAWPGVVVLIALQYVTGIYIVDVYRKIDGLR